MRTFRTVVLLAGIFAGSSLATLSGAAPTALTSPLAGAIAMASEPAAEKPIDVGCCKQLMIDRRWLANSRISRCG